MRHHLKVRLISAILALALSGSIGIGSAPHTTYAAEGAHPLVMSQGASGAQLIPQPAQTPPRQRMARFDEASGAFSVRYPSDLGRIRPLNVPGLYGYTFTNAAENTIFAVGFLVLSAADLSAGEWQMLLSALGPQGFMRRLGDRFDDPKFVEVTHEIGEADTHQLYWEGQYAEAEGTEELLYSALFVQEAEGILAITAVVTTQEDWRARRALFLEAFKSLEWSSETVRTQAGASVPPATAPTEEAAVPEETPAAAVSTEEAAVPPEETPAEEGEISPESIIEALVPEEVDLITPEETPEEGVTPEEPIEEEANPSGETVTFEDPNGVFELTYPAAFDTPEGPYVDEGYRYKGYIYAASIGGDEGHFVGLSFVMVAKKALSDAQWREKVNPIVKALLKQVGEDAVELHREQGKRGQHWLYFEAESEAEDRRMLFYLEEASGVLTILMACIPLAEWLDWEEDLLDMVRSFRWWPDAAREVLSGETAAPLVEPAPPPTQVRATPTPKSAQPAVPAGKGGLVMFNCRGDVVTVDVIPDAIFQELAPKTGDQCHRGEPIYLDPGEHILKASIAGVPSHGEATITIVEGQWFEFTWY
ncbi:MAG: hypothetical protein ACUVSF_09765 [Anaerolineae bacterium]